MAENESKAGATNAFEVRHDFLPLRRAADWCWPRSAERREPRSRRYGAEQTGFWAGFLDLRRANSHPVRILPGFV